MVGGTGTFITADSLRLFRAGMMHIAVDRKILFRNGDNNAGFRYHMRHDGTPLLGPRHRQWSWMLKVRCSIHKTSKITANTRCHGRHPPCLCHGRIRLRGISLHFLMPHGLDSYSQRVPEIASRLYPPLQRLQSHSDFLPIQKNISIIDRYAQ